MSLSFEDFVLDPGARELRRAGDAVPLTPKAYQLLELLVTHRPKALSKLAIQEHLWPNTFVVEKNLVNLIGEIRRALGDDPAQPRFVRTVHRFGYAFQLASAEHGATDIAAEQTYAVPLRRGTLPHPLTELLGRQHELEEVARRLTQSRLLTLTGAGGVGKTRLAIQLGEDVATQFADGVWFIDLAPLSEGAEVVRAASTVLGVREEAGRSLTDHVASLLEGKRALLILDNCEHLLAACAELVQTLLGRCAGVRVCATSRHALGVPGECAWRVPSLTVPDAPPSTMAQDDLVGHVLHSDAVQLFVARAIQCHREFRVTGENARAIAEICGRLDGIPLAIELAAGRMSLLAPEELASRLHDRFRLLIGSDHNSVPRHRTLRATLDWSHDLLGHGERTVLRRLSTFAGGATVPAAEAVCAGGDVDRASVVDFLTALVRQSLATIATTDGRENRCLLLETIREYAHEQLERSGETIDVRGRHAQFFLELALAAEPHSSSPEHARWLQCLEAEHSTCGRR